MTKSSDTFIKLVQRAFFIDESKLQEALSTAKQLEVPIERSLSLLKLLSEEKISQAIYAQEMIDTEQLSFEGAIVSLQLATKNNISLQQALAETKPVMDLKKKDISLEHPLAKFFISTKILTKDQLIDSLKKAKNSGISLGKALVINRFITRWVLSEVLSAIRLVEEKIITEEQAITVLQEAMQRHITVMQVLFESILYKGSKGETITLSELLLMADCLTESDYHDIKEFALVEKKTDGQIITEHKIIAINLLESAQMLLNMITGNHLKPFQAAEALRSIKTKGITVHQAISELSPLSSSNNFRLGDLLVEANIVSRESIENLIQQIPANTAIRIGKQLLDAGLISEKDLYTALRCQSLFREGIISFPQAINLLSRTHNAKLKIEDLSAQEGIYFPIRMQWNW